MSKGRWVIAGKPDGARPEVGRRYTVRHSRKGTFAIQVASVDGEWLTGGIVAGVAAAIMPYNVREEGESITIRDVHSHLTEFAA